MLVKVLRSPVSPYLVAVLTAAAALGLSLLLRPIVERIPFMFFWAAMVITVISGGAGPGLLVVVLSILAVDLFDFSPGGPFSADPTNLIPSLLFASLSGVIIWMHWRNRQIQTAARGQSEWSNTALRSVGDAVIATDVEGKITFLNPVAAALTGWQPEEALGQAIEQVFRIINEETRQRVENPVTRVLREGVVAGLANHTVLVGKDDSERPIDDSGAPIRDNAGRIIGSILVFRDIGERRRAERALRESEARFRLMADSAPVLIWMSDPDKRFTWVNKPWLEFTGRTMEQELGNGWAEGVHPDDYERCLNTYVTAFDARQSFTMDYRLRYRDGQYRWVVDTGVPLYSPDGSFSGYIGSCVDINERKEAEQALREFEAIVQSSDDAIITKSLDGIILSWNPGAERMYGYRAEEVIGKPISMLIPVDLADDMPRIMERLKKGEHVDHYETERIAKDGRRLNVSLSISPIRDSTGKLIAAVKIARDITERKTAEATLIASGQRFRFLADTVPGCVWTARPDGTIDYANRYWHEFCGFTEEQTDALEWVSILHPDDQERTIQAWTEAIREGKHYELEARNRRADGEYRWLLNRAVPVKDSQGTITAWFGTSMDVTDLKEAQERAALLQRLSAALSEAATPQQVAEVMVREGLASLGGNVVAVCRLNGASLELLNFGDVPQEVRDRFQNLSLDTPIPVADAIRTRQIVWIENLDAYLARYPHLRDSLQKTGSQAVLALPLVVEGRVIGGIGISFPRPNPLTETNRSLIESLAQQCAQALERAWLYETERQAREEAEHTAGRIMRLQAITAAFSEALTVDQIARIIVHEGINTFTAATGAVTLLSNDGEYLEVIYTSSGRLNDEEREAWKRFPIDPSLPVTGVVRNRQPIWLKSSEELRARYPALASLSERYPGAGAIIPLVVGVRVIGAVVWTFDEERQFDEDERTFMLALAQQCSQAMERARLYEQWKQIAVLEERQRLARELHDAVSQTLFAANVMAQSLPRLMARGSKRIPERLEELVRLTQGAASEMRTLLVELRPEMVLSNKLGDLVRQFAEVIRARKRLSLTLDIQDISPPLPPDVHVAFYRIGQETLNNVAKHSQATEVAVSLRTDGRWVRLHIQDNGQGFNVEEKSSGLGLASMRERARVIGAELNITSVEREGTEVTLVWQPLKFADS